MTPEQFWSRVERVDLDACWPWRGTKDRSGYGRVGYRDENLKHREERAHHMAYRLEHGLELKDLPTNTLVLHSCDNPPCCNPKHLRPGTHVENAADAMARGRLTNRKRGAEHYAAKLTDTDVSLIRTAFECGARIAELSAAFRVSYSNIRFIVQRYHWKHVA